MPPMLQLGFWRGFDRDLERRAAVSRHNISVAVSDTPQQCARRGQSCDRAAAGDLSRGSFAATAGGCWGLEPFMGGTYPVWVLVLTCFVKLLAISITVLAGFRGAPPRPGQTRRQIGAARLARGHRLVR